MNETLRPWPDDLYATPQREKEEWLMAELRLLHQHHFEHSEAYRHICTHFFPAHMTGWQNYNDLPYLTVSLFKQLTLTSVPPEEQFKMLSSSGTSGIASRVVLDKTTAKRQMQALTDIMKHWLGSARRPMLIIDSQEAIQDRSQLNARATATAGFSMFGTSHLYVFDQDMQIRQEALEAFLDTYKDKPLFIFGFTFMVWKWAQQSGKELDLSRALLLHGGGWKRLQDQAVPPAVFNQALAGKFQLHTIHNYYGMVEQVGSIFVACEHGFLHPPVFADVIVRHPQSLQPQPDGTAGALQLLSLIPTSYPGHSLLSEDEGVIHGQDDCPCGRKGKYFSVFGRLARAELRGCSDTKEIVT